MEGLVYGKIDTYARVNHFFENSLTFQVPSPSTPQHVTKIR